MVEKQTSKPPTKHGPKSKHNQNKAGDKAAERSADSVDRPGFDLGQLKTAEIVGCQGADESPNPDVDFVGLLNLIVGRALDPLVSARQLSDVLGLSGGHVADRHRSGCVASAAPPPDSSVYKFLIRRP